MRANDANRRLYLAVVWTLIAQGITYVVLDASGVDPRLGSMACMVQLSTLYALLSVLVRGRLLPTVAVPLVAAALVAQWPDGRFEFAGLAHAAFFWWQVPRSRTSGSPSLEAG